MHRTLQFQHCQRQSVDESRDVGADDLALALHDKLVGDEPAIGGQILTVEQAQANRPRLAILDDLDRHAGREHRVKCSVILLEFLTWHTEHGLNRRINHGGRRIRIERCQGAPEFRLQHALTIIAPCADRSVRRKMVAWQRAPTDQIEPRQRRQFYRFLTDGM